jgi:hypothetical protein
MSSNARPSSRASCSSIVWNDWPAVSPMKLRASSKQPTNCGVTTYCSSVLSGSVTPPNQIKDEVPLADFLGQVEQVADEFFHRQFLTPHLRVFAASTSTLNKLRPRTISNRGGFCVLKSLCFPRVGISIACVPGPITVYFALSAASMLIAKLPKSSIIPQKRGIARCIYTRCEGLSANDRRE